MKIKNLIVIFEIEQGENLPPIKQAVCIEWDFGQGTPGISIPSEMHGLGHEELSALGDALHTLAYTVGGPNKTWVYKKG